MQTSTKALPAIFYIRCGIDYELGLATVSKQPPGVRRDIRLLGETIGTRFPSPSPIGVLKRLCAGGSNVGHSATAPASLDRTQQASKVSTSRDLGNATQYLGSTNSSRLICCAALPCLLKRRTVSLDDYKSISTHVSVHFI